MSSLVIKLMALVAATQALPVKVLPAPTLSSQTAFAEAFAKADWDAVSAVLTEDATVATISSKGMTERSANGRVQGTSLLKEVHDGLGNFAVAGCEFAEANPSPAVVCRFVSTDPRVRSITSLARLANGRVSGFMVNVIRR